MTATIWLLGRIGVWLIGPANTSTIGASELIFGWLVFLLARGFLRPQRPITASPRGPPAPCSGSWEDT